MKGDVIPNRVLSGEMERFLIIGGILLRVNAFNSTSLLHSDLVVLCNVL